MRMSDWSSDVCSSDLAFLPRGPAQRHRSFAAAQRQRLAALLNRHRAAEDFEEAAFHRHRIALAHHPGHGELARNQGVATLLIFTVEAIAAGASLNPVASEFEIGRASCGERGCQYV